MKEITIGVLGGMGTRSTSPFLELLLDQCQEQYGAKYDTDYPHIIIYSLPTPFYIDRETDEEQLKKAIRNGVEKLQRCGVDVIGIPCNSAHSHFDFITENVKVPVLNIINETVKNIQEGTKVSIFATEMTTKSGLYQEGIRRKNCECIFDENWHSELNHIILRIKTKQNMKTTKVLWQELVSKAEAKEVEQIIVACTDLNVVLDSRENIEYIDSSYSLARSLIKMYLKLVSGSIT